MKTITDSHQTAKEHAARFNIVASIQGKDNLNFLNAAEESSLRIRILNNGPHSFLTRRAIDEDSRARITIDLSGAGKDFFVFYPPDMLPGFSLLPAADNSLIYTFVQTAPNWNFFSGDVISIVFSSLLSDQSGIGLINVNIENLENAQNFNCDGAIFTLKREGVPNNISANWKYGNSLVIDGVEKGDGFGILKCIINADSSFISGKDFDYPNFFIQLCDGLSPGMVALMAPQYAHDIEVDMGEGVPWEVSEFGNCAYPLWKLDYKRKHTEKPAPVSIKLVNVQHLNRGIDRAQIILYYLNRGEFADGYQVMNVSILDRSTEDSSDNISISFSADKTTLNNINSPTQVLLSWNVSNAAFVTLSGVGLVNPMVTNQSVMIEQTSTFILTAYSASLSQVASQSVTITVTPDLLTRVVPIGTVMMWNGQNNTIPTGWALCDGTNNTPDLRDKFIVGAGHTYAPLSNGAANSHQHQIVSPSGTFTTTTDGSHSHLMPSGWYGYGLSCGDHNGIDTNGNFDPATTTTQAAGDHCHTIDVTFLTFNSDNNNATVLPPWFALCYIMKTGV